MLEILLADDHELVRTGLRLVLETNPGWHVCGEAADGSEAVVIAARLRPPVAIIDLNMPVLNGLEAIRQIRQVSPDTSVIALTADDSGQAPRDAELAGAHRFVLKTDHSAALVRSVRALVAADATATLSVTPVAGGTPSLGGTPRRGFTPVRGGTPAPLPGVEAAQLTEREMEIARLLAEGKSNWVVARILGISMKTVETHRANIMRKLGLASVVELVHYAVRNQLVAL